jgi:DNA gyrase inhibitor GyrI
MSEIEVRVVKLESFQVASFLGFGESPEELAWQQLLPWAKKKGLLENLEKHRLFGFNNPDPSPGSPNYGYEVWIVIEPGDVSKDEDVEVKTFGGGLYAVARCVVPKGNYEVIGTTWKKLVAWRENSQYKCGSHQWLEESLPLDLPDTEFVLDLYLPISE